MIPIHWGTFELGDDGAVGHASPADREIRRRQCAATIERIIMARQHSRLDRVVGQRLQAVIAVLDQRIVRRLRLLRLVRNQQARGLRNRAMAIPVRCAEQRQRKCERGQPTHERRA